jgi:hypothetical protein
VIRRLSTIAASLIVFIFVGVIASPERAEAQEVSIPAAVALIGGGIAATIGNGIKAAKNERPDDLWDDAGWLIGGANVAIGTWFIVDGAVSEEPIWGALPIGISLATLGVLCLSMTAWAVLGAPYDETDWMDDDSWDDTSLTIAPTVTPDGQGGVRYGLQLSVWNF